MTRPVAFAAAAAVLTLGAAPLAPVADPSLAHPVATRLTGYLRPDALDGKTILGPPPAIDSPEDKADRAAYQATRALEGSPRWKQAQQDNDLWTGGAQRRLTCAMGRDLAARSLAGTRRLLHRVELDVHTVGTPPKDFYGRLRPPIGDSQPLCVPRGPWLQTNASYPSGHAMTGWAWALILAEIAPAKASALMVAGREIGQSRVVCGVHFPSDVAAGRDLGAAMVARLHADRAFQADLRAAKLELAKAPQPRDCPSA
ncbi:phosphatase PAP2 family protein [Phenylobacterium sp.]|uniref:acid phosphatase n=1 Tax=Phenylobacterium sp. TaxID=1871053 RepID=UPI00286D1B11|nr:phosphatase PAP2 family protein [Phenylobacterium sp.]